MDPCVLVVLLPVVQLCYLAILFCLPSLLSVDSHLRSPSTSLVLLQKKNVTVTVTDSL